MIPDKTGNAVEQAVDSVTPTGKPAVPEILNCLKQYGQRLDSELARETGMPIAKVRQRLAELAATGAIITCNLTRFEHGKRIEGLLCRMSGWVPPPAAGRKAKLPA